MINLIVNLGPWFMIDLIVNSKICIVITKPPSSSAVQRLLFSTNSYMDPAHSVQIIGINMTDRLQIVFGVLGARC